MTERIDLKKALWADEDFLAQLLLQKVKLSDHIEYTVWTQRLRPNENYSKTFIWTKDLTEAEETFNDVVQKNPEYKISFVNGFEHFE